MDRTTYAGNKKRIEQFLVGIYTFYTVTLSNGDGSMMLSGCVDYWQPGQFILRNIRHMSIVCGFMLC